MSRAHRSPRPALLFTTALLLSSCGIPETGVVEVGEPATGIRAAQVLYFAKAGTLLGVRRQSSGPLGVQTAVERVFQGPDALERRAGLTTELPPLQTAPTVRTYGGRVSVELDRGTGPLSETAIAQLTCTIADARLVEAAGAEVTSTRVTVTVPGAWRTEGSSDMCPSTAGAPTSSSRSSPS
jgi:hypothetical protein